mgnify:CR=1 FL=1|jgi:hypothetical protein
MSAAGARGFGGSDRRLPGIAEGAAEIDTTHSKVRPETLRRQNRKSEMSFVTVTATASALRFTLDLPAMGRRTLNNDDSRALPGRGT